MEEFKPLTLERRKDKPWRLLPRKAKDAQAAQSEERAFERLRRALLFGKKEGAKPFPWRSLSVRNLLIAGCAVFVLLAAYLNLRFAQSDVGQQEPVAQADSPQVEVGEDYFAVAVINRSRVRDEAIDMYQALADDSSASQTSREEAYASMNALVDRSAAEVDIENRVKAKGFSNCVAILEGDRASIIVQADGLTDSQVAQITEIVYVEAGIIPQNLTITEKV